MQVSGKVKACVLVACPALQDDFIPLLLYPVGSGLSNGF